LDAKVVCIDQTKTSVRGEPSAAWFPAGENPSIALSGQRDWTCLLGAVTDAGETFFSRFQEYVTADHAKHFILALCEEFDEDLVVVLDGAPYFRAATVTDLADRDGLELVYLPPYSPDLNPVEECWRQLKAGLGNRLFDSIETLTTRIDHLLNQLSVPILSNYF
jgi:hypothetical protein